MRAIVAISDFEMAEKPLLLPSFSPNRCKPFMNLLSNNLSIELPLRSLFVGIDCFDLLEDIFSITDCVIVRGNHSDGFLGFILDFCLFVRDLRPQQYHVEIGNDLFIFIHSFCHDLQGKSFFCGIRRHFFHQNARRHPARTYQQDFHFSLPPFY